ncbi:MAG: hypothetical protein FWF25_00260 [Propionibacteriaceae bacterium]|nr:hypothetical protein [Propionibacteriaceae bacterium]
MVNRRVSTVLSVARRLAGRSYPRLTRRVIQHSAETWQADLHVLFDLDYYVKHNPDVVEAGIDPYQHYLHFGAKEERQPSVLFDPAYYCRRVASMDMPSVKHFLLIGAFESMNPLPRGFDSEWYLKRHPRLRQQRVNPYIHYLTQGWKAGSNPSGLFDVAWYLSDNPDVAKSQVEPLTHYLAEGFEEGRTPVPHGLVWDPGAPGASQVLSHLGRWRSPLPLRRGEPARRITVVLGSIQPRAMTAGVTSAIVFACLWAAQTGRTLRLITRAVRPVPSAVYQAMESAQIDLPDQIELAYAPYEGVGQDSIATSDSDIYVTTSVWTTLATQTVVPSERIVCVLHDDERSRYPVGDEWLEASDAMNTAQLSILVNTPALRDGLVDTGLDALTTTGFPLTASYACFAKPGRRLSTRTRTTKMTIALWASPSSPASLFSHGLAALNGAIERGIVDTESFDVMIIGSGAPSVTFIDGTSPLLVEDLPWGQCAELLADVDIVLAPSAALQDSDGCLAAIASGAVTVVNRWPGKPSLAGQMDRIVETEPSVESMIDGIAAAIQRLAQVEDEPFTLPSSPFFQAWEDTMADAVAWAERRMAGV